MSLFVCLFLPFAIFIFSLFYLFCCSLSLFYFLPVALSSFLSFSFCSSTFSFFLFRFTLLLCLILLLFSFFSLFHFLIVFIFFLIKVFFSIFHVFFLSSVSICPSSARFCSAVGSFAQQRLATNVSVCPAPTNKIHSFCLWAGQRFITLPQAEKPQTLN